MSVTKQDLEAARGAILHEGVAGGLAELVGIAPDELNAFCDVCLAERGAQNATADDHLGTGILIGLVAGRADQ